MAADIAVLFNKYDALIAPTLTIASIPADWDPEKTPLMINNKAHSSVFDPTCTTYFNILSRCPVLNMPSGLDKNNVPTGIQIVAPSYRDEVSLRIGVAYQSSYQLFIDDKYPSFT